MIWEEEANTLNAAILGDYVNVTKKAFVEHVASGSHLTQKKVDQVLRIAFDAIWRTTRENGRFHYPGFGVWSVRTRRARRIRNPQTNEIMKLPKMRTIGFRAAKEIKAQM